MSEIQENVESPIQELLLGIDVDPAPKKEDEFIVEDVKPTEPEVKKESPKEDPEKIDFKKLNKKINTRVDARVERVEKMFNKRIEAEREAYVGAIATVNERLQAALDNNNIKEYAQATEALKTLNVKKEELETDLKVIKEEIKEAPEEGVEQPKKEIPIDEAAGRWLQTNKKFAEKVDADAELSAVARAISQKLLKNGYAEKPQIELLTEVKRQMLQKMPEDFAELVTEEDKIPNVSGGKMDITTTNNGGGKKIYTINDVPALDRQILKNYVQAKVYKDEKEAVTKYFQRKQQENR